MSAAAVEGEAGDPEKRLVRRKRVTIDGLGLAGGGKVVGEAGRRRGGREVAEKGCEGV
jgi:hypothetical protein